MISSSPMITRLVSILFAVAIGSGLCRSDVPVPPPIIPTPGDRIDAGGSNSPPGAPTDLREASKLFRAFRRAIDTDPGKADALFQHFLAMPSEMRRRLLDYLDREWLKRKRAVAFQRTANSHDETALRRRRESVRAHRETLKSIRSLGDEARMKEELKASGWDAMVALEKLYKGTDPQSSSSERLFRQRQERALRIGMYRSQIKESLQEPIEDPKIELGMQSDGPKLPDPLRIPAGARRILGENEKVLRKLPKPEAEGIRQVNHWRIYAGLQPLMVDAKLCDAARDHCKDMARVGFFAHESPVEGKRTPGDRAKRFGTRASGENIAINRSVAAANRSWFLSPGHHRNMFRASYTTIGVGQHGRHFTQMFR